jgi:hypothetical protein
MVLVSNVAGALDAALRREDTGPIQVLTLVVALVFGVGVPSLLFVSGQTFGHLLLRDEQADRLEQSWQANGYPCVYRAVFGQLYNAGLPAGEAKKRARQIASGYFPALAGQKLLQESPDLSVRAETSTVSALSSGIPLDNSGKRAESSGKGSGRIANASEKAMQAYQQGMTVQEVIDRRIAGKSTAYEVWKKFKGHQPE